MAENLSELTQSEKKILSDVPRLIEQFEKAQGDLKNLSITNNKTILSVIKYIDGIPDKNKQSAVIKELNAFLETKFGKKLNDTKTVKLNDNSSYLESNFYSDVEKILTKEFKTMSGDTSNLLNAKAKQNNKGIFGFVDGLFKKDISKEEGAKYDRAGNGKVGGEQL